MKNIRRHEYRRQEGTAGGGCATRVQRTTLGDFELTVFSDGDYLVDGGACFGVVPKVLWEKKVQADERNYLRFGLNSLLIRSGRHNVLVETGIGDKLPEKWRNIYDNQARLLTSLQGGGVSPEDIHVVINTHLHFDHCGWNTVRQGDNEKGKIVARPLAAAP